MAPGSRYDADEGADTHEGETMMDGEVEAGTDGDQAMTVAGGPAGGRGR